MAAVSMAPPVEVVPHAGHHLGTHGAPLFRDEVQAWAHGPVVPSVYHAFEDCGASPIDVGAAVGDDFDWDDYRGIEHDLVKVWATYGPIAAWALRNRTYRESPWRDALGGGTLNQTITQQAMRDFFAAA